MKHYQFYTMEKILSIIFVLIVGIPMMGLKMLSNLKAQGFTPYTKNYYFKPQNLGFSTPQTAELAKYVPSTVDYYNGLLDFELPILHYKDASFNIPITIKYISDGFKPGRRPSLIGNNWNLNVGGVITRNVLGRPDDENGINQNMFRDGLLAARRNGKYINYSKEELYNLNVPKASNAYPGNIGDLEHDFAPDIFNFSFGGHKGYFFIGNDGKVKSSLGEGFQIDIDKLSIQDHKTSEYSPINSTIKITTPDGYVYEFGGTISHLEYNIPNNPTGATTSTIQINSWYLNSIHNINNKRTVYFSYKKHVQRNEYKNFIYFKSSYTIWPDIFVPGYPMTINDPFSNYHTYKDNLETPIIDEIIIDDIRIKFKIGSFNKSFYNEGNYDLLYLDEIIESHGNTQKTISFEYLLKGNYFFLRHLKLNNQAINPDIYSFDYNFNTTLPDTRTIAVDHWGYWNGGFAIDEDTKNYLENIDNRKAVNTAVADVTMLTKITFPTMGETRITYEPNSYNYWHQKNTSDKIEWVSNYSSTPIACGGVRIKNIIDYDPVSKNEITRSYSYVTPDGKGSGIIGTIPKYRWDDHTVQWGQSQFINGQWIRFRTEGIHFSISSNTIGRLQNISEHHIGYSDVIEKYEDSSTVRYHFTSMLDTPDDENMKWKVENSSGVQSYNTIYADLEKYGLYNLNDMSGYRGKLLSKITYSSKQKMLLTQAYTYNTHEWLNNYEISILSTSTGLVSNRIYYTPCRIVKEVQTDFNGVEIHKMYSYNVKNMVSEEKIVQSNKDTLRISYIYPFENSTATTGTNYLADLVKLNKISEPVVTLKTIQRNKNNNSQLLSAIKYDYGKFNNQLLRSTFSEWSINSPTDVDYSLEKGNFTIKEQYLNYDAYGNVTHLLDKNRDTVIYIWSYIGKYPIAEIKGATYEQVKLALDDLSPESLSNDTSPDIDKINALRVKLPHASINTYTYSPLIGLITSTNPQGITTYFEYDSSGKLRTVKDDNQNIIKEYYYKYFNQSFEGDHENNNYCNVTFDTSAPGGDGLIKTVKMKYGEQLPIPTPSPGYTFEGWYDGDTKITTVPNSPNRTITGKFVLKVIDIIIRFEHWEDQNNHYYKMVSSAPVSTNITATQEIHYKQENICEGIIEYEQDMLIEVTIPKGETSAETFINISTGQCSLSSIICTEKAIKPWDGKTINGAHYISSSQGLGGWH